MNKAEDLEGKIRKIIERLGALRKDNDRLRGECESLKSHVTMLTGENNKAARIMAEYQQLRRTHDQVAHRVERALQKLSTLGAH